MSNFDDSARPQAQRHQRRSTSARFAWLWIVILANSVLAKDEPKEPIPFDWSLVPVAGDADYQQKRKALAEKYAGKEVIVSGATFIQHAESQRMMIFVLRVPAKRGGSKVYSDISAQFDDPDQALLRRQLGPKSKAQIIGTVSEKAPGANGGALLLEKSRVVEAKKKK